VGIGGAYLMPIKGPANPPLMNPPVVQLSPEWWDMIKHAFAESKRLGIKLGLHASDGFALAGGPWITPDLSMQKIVWTEKKVNGGKLFNEVLEQPETLENYYKDIAVFAFPSLKGSGISTRTKIPKITSSKTDSAVQMLTDPGNKKTFSSDDPCWIKYEFNEPFTCRAIIIRSRNNYQSNRLIVQVSDDGNNFRTVKSLEAPRHGWQDWDAEYTHSIQKTTSKFFRFIYDKEGSEPGAEDLDAAKWRQSLKITGLELLGEPRIDQYEGKNGEVWRISKYTTIEMLPDSVCVPLNKIIDISSRLDSNGKLNWDVPAGEWTILRMGHTSTGHRNETGGGGKGLECDKFNPAAITIQFNKWFGEFYNQVDEATIKEVLQFFHVDSWECGSQNWSTDFRNEFKKRRGYDLFPYLPLMAGIPVGSANLSERFLHDVRATIAELVNDVFYVTLARLAHQKGIQFTAESVAPTMLSDGMLHYKNVDIPMGEFWLKSPTHDKPNDMLDAISAAHIYGKNIIQAEGFTELRMAWDEHPGMLKTLGDRNFALGINRFVYHVFTHNPWMDRKPGMTLDPIGLYFQRDQIWWKQSKAWVDYAKRCQALLQLGKPVVDIAVYTGDEFPRRSILPDRLVPVLPGIFGKEIVEKEKKRLKNEGEPLRQIPSGVTHSANMADPEDWIDPLNGYAYDSYNTDALLHLSKVNNGKIELTTGARYSLLVIPGQHKMSPEEGLFSVEAAEQIRKFVKEGARVVLKDDFTLSAGLFNANKNQSKLAQIHAELIQPTKEPWERIKIRRIGKGVLEYAPYMQSRFAFPPDFWVTNATGQRAGKIAWNHRSGKGFDIYFISNQKDSAQIVNLSLRVSGKIPEIWDPVTGETRVASTWKVNDGRTELPVYLDKNASLFVVLQQNTQQKTSNTGKNWPELKSVQSIEGPWRVKFAVANGGPKDQVMFNELSDWSKNADSAIRYYSGTGIYSKTIRFQPSPKYKKVWLNIGEVHNLAEVFVNGISCGIIWTAPYRVDITKALKEGENSIRIDVVNTWSNRLVGDSRLSPEKRITNTVYPFKWEAKPLLPAGLIGPVVIQVE
ncbi:MAG TPA: glycosyl hydrolase, partial [Chitinophagaceae bacterium]|nr:glycosyl hydrolase [Chitinophagaceae bacterium]